MCPHPRYGPPMGVHANHRAFWRHLARICDGEVEEVPGGLLVATGIPAAGFNQLHGDAVEAAAGFFDARGLPWRIIAEQPSPVIDAFAAGRGVAREPRYPILTLPAADSVAPPETPLMVARARDVAQLRAFVDCAAAGYRTDPALLRPLAHKRALADDDLRVYLGRLDGRCVAVSIGVRHGETIGVYFVAVRRENRRQGFGAAVTWRAAYDGFADGASTAVLQATNAGYPLYTGMGFGHIGDYHLWDFPGKGSPPPSA